LHGSVWLDPCERPFDENPVLGFMHTASDTYSPGSEGKKFPNSDGRRAWFDAVECNDKAYLEDIADFGQAGGGPGSL
jgi:hypothetical protein